MLGLTQRVCYTSRGERVAMGKGTPVERPTDGTFESLLRTLAYLAGHAVRYQPRHLDLALACGAQQPEVPAPVARWLADTRVQPALLTLTGVPHGIVRVLARRAAEWFGPTGSAL